MVSNLLNNAAKYTPARGHIRLELNLKKDHVEICVVDDGVGLEPEALERVFDMFAQVDDHKEHARGGWVSAWHLLGSLPSYMEDRFPRVARGPGGVAVFRSRYH
jgi:hypothetical protein